MKDRDDPKKKHQIQHQPVGFLWQAGNVLLRQRVNIEPQPASQFPYPGEYAPDASQVKLGEQKAPTNVKYQVDEVLVQPTPHSCIDTAAMMVLKFHREKLDWMLNDPKSPYQFNEITKQFLGSQLRQLDQYSKTVAYESFGLHDWPDVTRLYNVAPVYIWKDREAKSSGQLAEELAYQLYMNGPVTFTIRSSSFSINRHDIVIIGMMNEHVLYLDPWTGKDSYMSIEELVKKTDLKEPCIGVLRTPGYSHSLRHKFSAFEATPLAADVKISEEKKPSP